MKKRRQMLIGLMLGVSLSACAGMTLIGAGCVVYAKARADFPYDALDATPPALVAWLNALEATMRETCST